MAYHALGPNKGLPMMHPPHDLAIPSAPGEGMIPAARPADQVTSPQMLFVDRISSIKPNSLWTAFWYPCLQSCHDCLIS